MRPIVDNTLIYVANHRRIKSIVWTWVSFVCIVTWAFLIYFGSVALSNAKPLPVCNFVYSKGINGDWREKYWHEMAHCNGWEHAIKASFLGKAYDPPKKYLIVYPGPINARLVTVSEAKRICKGAMSCQWFEGE